MAIDEIDDVSGDAGEDRPDGEGHMTLMDHVAELRTRLLKTVVAVGLAGVVAWIFYPTILDVLLAPYCDSVADRAQALNDVQGSEGCNLLVTDPLEGFTTRLKIAAYGGIALAMPVILWQLWRFISPGLYSHERKWAVPFVIAGVMVGISAVMLSSRLNSVSPGDAGLFYELDAIAAVVIGGTALAGGRGTIWGTVIGVIILGIINNMLNLLGVSAYLQGTVKGLVILIAVLAQFKGDR